MPKLLNATQLKLIAIISMLIDHIGMVLYPDVYVLRIIGRLAFPIFAFLIIEGYYHTSNFSKYLMRITIFALLSQIPFTLATWRLVFYYKELNVYFTFVIALLMIYLIERCRQIELKSLIFIASILIVYFLNSQYNVYGMLMIFSFYYFRNNDKLKIISITVINIAMAFLTTGGNVKYVQLAAPLALIFIYLYNGQRGKGMKYFFYVFYPLHFLVLFFIKVVLFAGI